MLAVLALTYLSFRLSHLFARALGHTGIVVLTRLFGILLAALSVQFVLDGLRDYGFVAGPEMARDPDTLMRMVYLLVLLVGVGGLLPLGPARAARAVAARPRDLGADLRHGGDRLRLPRRAAPGAAAVGDGAGRARRHRAPPRRATGISTPSSRSTASRCASWSTPAPRTSCCRCRDAERVGLDPGALDFTGRALTANGPVGTAAVRLGLVQFGDFTDTDVAASVSDGGLDDLAARHVLSRPLRGDRDQRRPDDAAAVTSGAKPALSRQREYAGKRGIIYANFGSRSTVIRRAPAGGRQDRRGKEVSARSAGAI